ncbi:hypothetical protein GK047_18035 [Paenibacillus sp. SYP-B3998]|uniref:Copper amine oxidase-like N-terminal domain-containing protein n=1 Tax=Paenibacillus sp. SYP-B3998 TaxID=2678564 RepID=A0A6G4A0I4_9BACL|nr:hypothetical protein [Paenibacillus sp. SYP-B3998]
MLVIQRTTGEKKSLVNGVTMELTALAFIHNGSTFIPLRFIEEATGEDIICNANRAGRKQNKLSPVEYRYQLIA